MVINKNTVDAQTCEVRETLVVFEHMAATLKYSLAYT
jgi:hypothetical protein